MNSSRPGHSREGAPRQRPAGVPKPRAQGGGSLGRSVYTTQGESDFMASQNGGRGRARNRGDSCFLVSAPTLALPVPLVGLIRLGAH